MNRTTPDIPWQGIVTDVAEALIYADRDGIIRVWNAQAEAVFGFSAAEALGQSLDLIIPEHLREAHWVGWRAALERGHTRLGAQVRTTRGLHREGRKLYVDMSFAVVHDAEGRACGSVAMARDATERYLAERARRDAAKSGG